MRPSAQTQPSDDVNNLESLEDVEESTRKKKGPAMQNVVPMSSFTKSEMQFEGIDVSSDGKLKISFSNGLDLIVDPSNKALNGKGVNVRIGSSQATVASTADGVQFFINGLQFNMKR